MQNTTLANDIATVTAAGGTFTDKYHRLTQRRKECDPGRIKPTQLYIDAVLSNKPQEEVALWGTLARAAAGTGPVEVATVRNALDQALTPLIQEEIAQTAEANWQHIRGQFNATAKQFQEAHNITPANEDPANLINATAKIREAWSKGQALALQLDALIPSLQAAARLAGHTQHNPLGLCINADGLHRRRVWEAWDSEHRWTQLIQLGATIQAPELDEKLHYREPKPMEKRHKRGRLGLITVEHDPEDPQVEEQEEVQI